MSSTSIKRGGRAEKLPIGNTDGDDKYLSPKHKDHSPSPWPWRWRRHRQTKRKLFDIIALITFSSCIPLFYTKLPRFPQCWPAIGTLESQSRIIVTASHLRQGPDGELRLRIIQHNLQLLFLDKSSNEKPLRSILVFSTDGSKETVNSMISNWRSGPAEGLVHDVILVDNDAVAVDVKKWMAALNRFKEDIWNTNARVMMTNDSFLLVRDVPELWEDNCGGVCGLVWTAPKSEPSRHIQSYMRSLSACEIDNYMNLCNNNQRDIHNVNELIEKFEVNLGWAGGKVSALFEHVGEHPDGDGAQHKLLPRGYPAIKLKKFFITDDPWITAEKSTRPRLPPSFSTDVYRKMNHELNHFSDQQLKDHFVDEGVDQQRIYSTLPLKMKDWIRIELAKMGDIGQSTLEILEDYLNALNRVNGKGVAK